MPDARGGELSGQQARNQHHNQLRRHPAFSTHFTFLRLLTESHVCISICIHLCIFIKHHINIWRHDTQIHLMIYKLFACSIEFYLFERCWLAPCLTLLRLDEAALAPLAALPALRVLNVSRQSEPTCFFLGTCLNCLQESCPRPFSFGLSSLPMFGIMGLVLMWEPGSWPLSEETWWLPGSCARSRGACFPCTRGVFLFSECPKQTTVI